MQTKTTHNYLNNRDVLRNIHLSKATYTWYIDGSWKDTKYSDYDIIMCDDRTYEDSRRQLILQKINRKLLETDKKRVSAIKDKHLKMLTDEDYEDIDNKILLYTDNTFFDQKQLDKIKLEHHNRLLYEAKINRVSSLTQEELDNIDPNDIVIRVFTYQHIPEKEFFNPDKVKKVSDEKEKLIFPPYIHVTLIDGKPVCVAKSHYNKNNEFSPSHGRMNNDLAKAFVELCTRYSSRYNWRGYSYVLDMQSQALVQLTSVGLQFNELFSRNPFSYYTSTIKNAFTIIFYQEKKAQSIRDALLFSTNQSPSWTWQLQSELSRTEHWDEVLDNGSLDGGTVKKYTNDEVSDYESQHPIENDDEVTDLDDEILSLDDSFNEVIDEDEEEVRFPD